MLLGIIDAPIIISLLIWLVVIAAIVGGIIWFIVYVATNAYKAASREKRP